MSADVERSGQLELPRFSGSVEREGAWTVIGLQGDTARLEGAGSFHLDAVVRPVSGPERSYELDYSAEYDGVLIRVDDRLIVGGTASYEVSAERMIGEDVEARFSMEAEVSFAADGSATLVLDGTHSHRVDTRTGVVVRI